MFILRETIYLFTVDLVGRTRVVVRIMAALDRTGSYSEWQSAVESVSLSLWNPSMTPGGHHNRDEDVVSSRVAVPPIIICIVIYTYNCDLSIPSHDYINFRGGVHKSTLKSLIMIDCRPKIFDLIF